MQPTEPQQELHGAYAKFLDSADGKLILADLTIFCQQETENPVVRAGRLDMLARILRSGQRSAESVPPARSIKTRAPLGQTTGEE